MIILLKTISFFSPLNKKKTNNTKKKFYFIYKLRIIVQFYPEKPN